MWLGIDIGNTRTKYYLSENGKLIERVFREDEIPWNEIEKAAVVQTGKASEKLAGKLKNPGFPVIYVNTDIRLPFDILYKSATLGADRIALITGAWDLYGNNVLVIDAGTCITYDYLDEAGQYRGGAISPGIRMRYRALNTYTEGLPLLVFDGRVPPLTGDSTELSIHSGVVHGVLKEIEGVVNEYTGQYPGIKVVLTGGDADFLSESLKIRIFAHQKFLSAYGLNKILSLNGR